MFDDSINTDLIRLNLTEYKSNTHAGIVTMDNVSFGYLFFNMKKRLCFTVEIEKNDVLAIEYSTPSASALTQSNAPHEAQMENAPQWSGAGLCPVWWAKHHPAHGITLPDPEGLKETLMSIINERVEKMISQKLDTSAEPDRNGAEDLKPWLSTGRPASPKKHKKHSSEEIYKKLREAEKLSAKGMYADEVARQIGVSTTTYYRWKEQHGALAQVV